MKQPVLAGLVGRSERWLIDIEGGEGGWRRGYGAAGWMVFAHTYDGAGVSPAADVGDGGVQLDEVEVERRAPAPAGPAVSLLPTLARVRPVLPVEVSAPRCVSDVDEEAVVTVHTPAADECREAGREAAGPKDRAADQFLSGLITFEAVG